MSSTFFGNIHRAGYTERLVEIDGRQRLIVSGSPGALRRVDGTGPSARSSYDLSGTPSKRTKAWSQSVAVPWLDPTDSWSTPSVEHIRIVAGRAVWRGREYVSRVTSGGEPA